MAETKVRLKLERTEEIATYTYLSRWLALLSFQKSFLIFLMEFKADMLQTKFKNKFPFAINLHIPTFSYNLFISSIAQFLEA